MVFISKSKRREPLILAVNQNISENKRLQEQINKISDLDQNKILASGLLHDLRSVLSSLFLAIRVLKPKLVHDEQGKTILSLIDASANRGMDMIQNMFKTFGNEPLQRTKVTLSYLVDELNECIKETFPKHVRFKILIPDGIWPIFANTTQIYQVLLNLCMNARDAIKNRNGQIKVEILNILLTGQQNFQVKKQPGRYVLIRVSDSGMGIRSDVLSKIFNPFFSTKKNEEGIGIGLNNVKTIINAHNGYLEVDSTLGKGTIFELYLPAA